MIFYNGYDFIIVHHIMITSNLKVKIRDQTNPVSYYVKANRF